MSHIEGTRRHRPKKGRDEETKRMKKKRGRSRDIEMRKRGSRWSCWSKSNCATSTCFYAEKQPATKICSNSARKPAGLEPRSLQIKIRNNNLLTSSCFLFLFFFASTKSRFFPPGFSVGKRRCHVENEVIVLGIKKELDEDEDEEDNLDLHERYK